MPPVKCKWYTRTAQTNSITLEQLYNVNGDTYGNSRSNSLKPNVKGVLYTLNEVMDRK